MRPLKFLALVVLAVTLTLSALSGCASKGGGGGEELRPIIETIALEIDATRVPQFDAASASNPFTCFLDIVNLGDNGLEFSGSFTVAGNLFDTTPVTLLAGDYIVGWDCRTASGSFIFTTNPALGDPIAIDFLDVNAAILFLLRRALDGIFDPEFQINSNKIGTLEIIGPGVFEPAARIRINELGNIFQDDFPSPGRVVFSAPERHEEQRLNSPSRPRRDISANVKDVNKDLVRDLIIE